MRKRYTPIVTGTVLLAVLAAGGAAWADSRVPTCSPSSTIAGAAVCIADTTVEPHLDVDPDVALDLP